MNRTSRLVFVLPLLILAAFAVLPSSAAAGDGVWTSLGPDGAAVQALAVDPLDPDVVYAGTVFSAVFKSTDGGATWAFAGRGLNASYLSLSGIAADPVHPGTVYAMASEGLFKTTDGGGFWVRIWDGALPDAPGGFASIHSLALDPRQPDTVYAGTGAGLYRSTDGGATWTRGGTLAGPVLALAVDSPGGWLFATVAQTGIFKSSDQGATWTAASHGLPPSPFVNSLAIDPDHPQTLLAGTLTGVYRTFNRGERWRAVRPWSIQQRTLVAFQRRGRAYAALAQSGIFRSADAGTTWKRVLNLSPQSGYVALAAGPVAVYAGETGDPVNRGLLRSLDGGATWEPAMRGLSALAISAAAVDPSDPRTLYAGGTSLFQSTDRGATWKRLALDIPPNSSILDILIDPARPARVYAITNDGPPSLFRSDDGGATWHAMRGDSVPEVLSDLTVDPRAPGALWGAGSGDHVNGLFHSDDGGTTWERIEGLPVSPSFYAQHVEVDPRDPRNLYLGAAENVGNPQHTESHLFRSTDGGKTWEHRDAGLIENGVRDIALDPDDPSTLYVLTDGVSRSTDAGASWSLLPARGRLILSIATAPAGPGTPAALYAARWEHFGASAVMCSTDRGETWTALRKGLNSYTPLFVKTDPTDPRRLYVGTIERGLMSYTRE